jgi:hypothetical protein
MITQTGKGIIAKYLIGQAPAYASYIAVGCGAVPLDLADPLPDYSDQKTLEFEMFRVPITSRGFVTENGQDKVVLTAELPTEERYEITEVGIFSAGSNPSAGAYDSRTLYAFTENENWEHHTQSAAVAIAPIYDPLDENEDSVISVEDKVFQTNADNRVFTQEERLDRNERSRFLNNIIVMSGDTSKISVSQAGRLSVEPTWTANSVNYTSSHIHLNGQSPDFNKQSPLDELRLAFSVINKDGISSAHPSRVLVLVEFSSADAHGEGQYARFEVDLEHDADSPINNFTTNRYFIVKKQLQELIKDPDFSWSAVNIAKVYVSVLDTDGDPSSDFYVCLDAIRIENRSSQNPLYGLTGYSAIKNTSARPIVKSSNTTNFIEFRFGVGVA